MFKLSEGYQIDRRILKCDYIRNNPSEIGRINTPNFQISKSNHLEEIVLLLC